MEGNKIKELEEKLIFDQELEIIRKATLSICKELKSFSDKDDLRHYLSITWIQFSSQIPKKLSKLKILPNLPLLIFIDSQKDNRLSKRFMDTFQISPNQWFSIVHGGGLQCPKLNKLLSPLCSIQRLGLKSLSVSRADLNQKELFRLICAFRHLKQIELLWVKITADKTIDLGNAFEDNFIEELEINNLQMVDPLCFTKNFSSIQFMLKTLSHRFILPSTLKKLRFKGASFSQEKLKKEILKWGFSKTDLKLHEF
jgi:hypothetical protein